MRHFLLWAWQVLKMWFVLVSLIPNAIAVVWFYFGLSHVARSSWISRVLQTTVGSPLYVCVSVCFLVVALLGSAYRAHSRIRSKYEDQKPEYGLTQGKVSSKLWRDSGGVHVTSEVAVKSRNSWPGFLAKVAIQQQPCIESLTNWRIVQTEFWSGNSGDFIRKQPPFEIPNAGCELRLQFEAEIRTDRLDIQQRRTWESIAIKLDLLIEYYSQPDGPCRYKTPISVKADLSQLLPDAIAYLSREAIA